MKVKCEVPVYESFKDGEEANIKVLVVDSWIGGKINLSIDNITVCVSGRTLREAILKAME